jgi:hypothetical protein
VWVHTDRTHRPPMTPPRSSRYQLRLTGPLPRTVTELIDERFGPAARICVEESRTVVDMDGDQASLRALLTLLWDVGQEVASVCRSGPLPEAPER